MTFGNCFGQSTFESIKIPEQHQQIVWVTTTDWQSPTGKLTCFARNGDQWERESPGKMIVVGKNGLGWGRGLHVLRTNGPEKIEGDGKAPAGVFELGDAFGYASSAPKSTSVNYRQVTNRDYFIDDINSKDYNQWKTISSDKENNPRNFWSSYERMKRSDHLYELGLVVKHNTDPVEKSKGSAIFLHVWRREASPTVGCTAMDKQDLVELLHWLDPAKNPILIQIPEGEMEQIEFR